MMKYKEKEEELTTSVGFSDAYWEYFFNAIKTKPNQLRRATVERRASFRNVPTIQERKRIKPL